MGCSSGCCSDWEATGHGVGRHCARQPTMLEVLCTGKSCAQYPQSSLKCPAEQRGWGKLVCYYSNPGPNSILNGNRKHVFGIHRISWEGNSYVNLNKENTFLVPFFTKGCPPFRKLKSVRAVSLQYLSLYHNTLGPILPKHLHPETHMT